MQRQDALAGTARLLTTAVFLLIGAHMCASSEPTDIFNELHIGNSRFHQLPSSSPDNIVLSSEENTPRLNALLRLKLSMLDILSQFPEEDGQVYDPQDQLDTSRLTKRVFCNGFTGCGGRFRGRRRQQPPVAEIGKRLLPNYRKRPFCNSYGCYNSGKKRFNQVPIKNGAAQMAPLTEDWFQDKIKRLFCNSYGGCQNMAKRVVVMDPDVARSVNEELRTPFPFSRLTLEKLENLNQAFSSDFDEEAAGVLSNMRR
uniref:Ccap 2 n=1 Tax=Deroceras reticulatum TaxID=145610 RepID=A0A1X9WEC3_DERRE|nr:ccap 2 [Deroceras reticulatum]